MALTKTVTRKELAEILQVTVRAVRRWEKKFGWGRFRVKGIGIARYREAPIFKTLGFK